MKMTLSRLRTLGIGLLGGVSYAALAYGILSAFHDVMSVSFIFGVPLVMGAIPSLFSSKEQLTSYLIAFVIPWASILLFLLLAYASGFEGTICIALILAPFMILGSLGGYIFRMIRLRKKGRSTPLYTFLFLPYALYVGEANILPSSDYQWVSTQMEIAADQKTVWENTKNVRAIRDDEISLHFVHAIGVPKPMDGRLDHDGVGGIRNITWKKGIQFQEKIKSWKQGQAFSYDIHVDPASIPPKTLDEHVMVGGRYFDVIEGGYSIDPLPENRSMLTLRVKYRVTTTFNAYGRWWVDFLLDDFNRMILEVIKKRSEAAFP